MLTWRINPLPDFLTDHTLPGESHAERLREVVSRWVQWVGNLWGWHDRATFAIRYLAQTGGVEVFLLGLAHDPAEEKTLAGEIGVLLRAHRLTTGRPLEENLASKMTERWKLPQMTVIEVRQHETRSLWQLRTSLLNSDQFRQQFQWLPNEELAQPRVVYPWWAPGGPFLVPMESLISQPVPVALTVYLQPTKLQPHEWAWLATMASEAQSKGEQNVQQLGAGAGMRVVDPSANLAGRLYIANLRRLSTNPFLVTVHCAAAQQRNDVARSVAGAIQSLVQEPPFDRPQQEDDRLPSAADMIQDKDDVVGNHHRSLVLQQYDRLRFPSAHRNDPLLRLPYLVDARGATTVFRLPISVRGGVPGICVRQLPPDFHPGARIDKRPKDCIELGRYQAGGKALVPIRDLTKHTLITGFTGSGKTVTVLQILHQLWADHRVPFLVLESAKQEYRGLFGVAEFSKDLRVYTVGNELCSPIRLNPFELLPGLRVEAHLGKLQSCFEGAIPPIGPSSSVISESLLRVYDDAGWSLTDVYPITGTPKRRFPTLSDFVKTVELVLEERGYEGEVQSNLRAALVGRFKPLLLGGKGRMFDTQRTTPTPEELFQTPTILELNDLNLDDKALVVMFLLTILREYRERNKSTTSELLHVTVVEEAHNVLENVASKGSGEGATSADTRFKAVEAFCQLLTEIRALGEGLVIADQSPEKLARDAMRNTNLQIAHQLRDSHDREAVASAMIMEKEQKDFLGKLQPGQAAIFRTGLEKATFVQIEPFYPFVTKPSVVKIVDATVVSTDTEAHFRGKGFESCLTDGQISKLMDELCPQLASIRSLCLPYQGCDHCKRPCEYRDPVFADTLTAEFQCDIESWYQKYCNEKAITKEELQHCTAVLTRKILERAGISTGDPDAGWCVLVHLWHRQFGRHPTDNMRLDHEIRKQFMQEFMASAIFS